MESGWSHSPSSRLNLMNRAACSQPHAHDLTTRRREQWLDTSRTSFVKAKSVLKPYPDELMDAHDVLPIVNSAKYEGSECIQPVSDDEIPSGRQLSLL
jgi:hypothetical protein